MTGPLVTVVVPNYNYARTLGLCLAAVKRQRYEPLEVVYVDDCSTDDSVRVAESFGVRVLSTPRNSGVSVARNIGAAHARGEILFFVDSDVALDPDAVANAVAALCADPAVGGVCGAYHPEPLIRDGLVEEYRNFHQHYWLNAAAGRIADWVQPAMLAVRADAFAEVGRFNEGMRGSEGAEFGRRLCQRYEVRLDPTVRGHHDNDHLLRVILRKVFLRAHTLFPFYVRGSRLGDMSSTPQARGSLLALLSAAGLPLPFLFGPVWAALPALLLAAAVAADARMYAAVWRARGPAFALFFVAVHTLVNVTGGVGAAVGALHWLVSRRYRTFFDATPEPVPRPPARRVSA